MTSVANLYYFPPISYIRDVFGSEEVLIEVNENYQKRTYRNKCRILGPNGVETLNIPLKKGKNQQQSIQDVEISYAEDFRKVHWRAIQTNYNSSPYFIHYVDVIRPIFDKKYTFLYDLNWDILKLIKNLLDVPVILKSTEDFIVSYDQSIYDYRDNFKKKKNDLNFPSYPQVYSHKYSFASDLSFLDALFCMGPAIPSYILNINKTLVVE